MQSITWRIIFIGAFVIIFFSTRFHSYELPLVKEEGMFAELLINQPKEPAFILIARIDGENQYTPPRHPSVLYNTLKFAGLITYPLIDHIPWQEDRKITPPCLLAGGSCPSPILLLVARRARLCP